MKNGLIVLLCILTGLTIFVVLRQLPKKTVQETKAAVGVQIGFSPRTAQASESTNSIPIDITVSPGASQINGATISISFDKTKLEGVSFEINQSYFQNTPLSPISHEINNTDGFAFLSFYVPDDKAGTGDGILARFTVKPKAVGQSALAFITTGVHQTTITAVGEDLSVLSQDGAGTTGTVQISSNTPTPTNPPETGGTDISPTPTNRPESNNTIPTCATLSISPDRNITTKTLITFSCTGVDPDGDITGIEIEFGDGNKKLVEKNVGSPGTLSTTYTYTSTGTFGATCRVRDNNYVFSGIPGACQKVISVSSVQNRLSSSAAQTTAKPTTKPRTTSPTPSATLDPTPTTIRTPTPTRSYTYERPQPNSPDNDDGYPGETEDSSVMTFMIAGVLGAVLLLGLFLLFRKPKSGGGTPPLGNVILHDDVIRE